MWIACNTWRGFFKIACKTWIFKMIKIYWIAFTSDCGCSKVTRVAGTDVVATVPQLSSFVQKLPYLTMHCNALANVLH